MAAGFTSGRTSRIPRIAGLLRRGFDVKAYLESFTSRQATLRPEDEPGDYKALADFAAHAARRAKPILIGVSEGAGLSVLAATDPATQGGDRRRDRSGPAGHQRAGLAMEGRADLLTHGVPNEPTFSTAAIVDRVVALAARRDPFDARRVRAARRSAARARLPRREPKRLWIVQASDHRFSDNLAEFDRRLLEAIAWVTSNSAALRSHAMLDRLRQALPVVIGLALFVGGARGAARRAARGHWHELTADVLQTRRASRLAPPLVLTALNYAALTGYDLLAFAYIGKPLPRARIALASFLAYAIANNVGFAMLSGASVRYRFYTRWGVTAEELSRIVFSLLRDVLARAVRARRPQPGRSARCPSARRLPAHQFARSRGLAADAGAGGVPRGHDRAADAAPDRAASSCRCRRPSHRARAARDLGGRLGARRRGALRAAAAGAALVPHVPRRLPRRRSCSAWSATCPAASACSRG